MTKDELREKANDLPLAPGVYLMMDSGGQVIYVGKAKKLKNRVSQYFQDTASHNSKTKMMAMTIHVGSLPDIRNDSTTSRRLMMRSFF